MYSVCMNLPALAILFTVYSAAGWVLDSFWRSVTDHKFERGGFSFLPLCPVYGVGAFVALWIESMTRQLPIPLEGLIMGLALAALEYATGRLWLAIAGHRLWNYKKTLLNIGGHTDLFHFFVWGILGMILVRVVNPWLVSLIA